MDETPKVIISIIYFVILIISTFSLSFIRYWDKEKNNTVKGLIFIPSALIIIGVMGLIHSIFLTSKWKYAGIAGIILYLTGVIWKGSSSSLDKTYVGTEITGTTLASIIFILFIIWFRDTKRDDYYFIFNAISVFVLIFQLIDYNIILKDLNNKSQKVLIYIFIAILVISTFSLFLTYFKNTSTYVGIAIIILIIVGVVIGPTISTSINTSSSQQPLLPLNPPLLPLNPPLLPLTPPKLPNISNATEEIPKLSEVKIVQILKNLNQFYAINDCKSRDSTDCNYLYKKLIDIKNKSADEISKNTDEVYAILDTMQDDALRNQNIYLIYQLLQSKMLLKNPTIIDITNFGTFRWLQENIWGNPLQMFIYFISFFAMLGLGLYFLYNIFGISKLFPFTKGSSLFEKLIGKPSSGGFVIGTGVTAVVTIFYIIMFWIIQTSQTEQKYDVPKDLDPYLEKKSPGESTSERDVRRARTGLKWVMPISLIGLSLLAFFSKNEYIQAINIGNWLGLIIAFNAFYTAMVPQIMVLGTLLQKFILMSPLDVNDMTSFAILIGKCLIFIVVLITSMSETQYKTKTVKTKMIYNPETRKLEEAPSQTESPQSTNLFIWFLFGVLISYYGVNAINTFIEGGNILDDNKFTLILMPLVRYILNLTSSKQIKIDDISVTI